MAVAGIVASFVLSLAILVLLARGALVLVRFLVRDWRPKGTLGRVDALVMAWTNPPMQAIRSVVPRLPIGGVSWDPSYALLLVGTVVLLRLVSLAWV